LLFVTARDKSADDCSRDVGIVNAMLSRVCVPGVFLIAALSGGGAVNTAWEAYEMRSISSA
jgi:hypothetical protein